jgi:hypothetical protein
VIIGLLLLGLVAGVVLVVTGGSADDDTPDADGTEPTATLPFDRVSMADIEEWSGLDVPDDAEGFLTARVGDGQLDVTFAMASDDEAGFVSGSALPEPVAGERQVLHSSPLWKLNPGAESDEDSPATEPTAPADSTDTTLAEAPDADTEVVADVAVRATADTHEDIRRAVELVDEGTDTVRARIVLTAG